MKICSIDKCDRKVWAKGLCNKHYNNLRNYGHAVALRDMTAMQRMEITGWDVTDSGCWEWRGAKSEKGYGIMNVARLGINNARAHRVMYEEATGDILGDRILRHRCDNPPCVNPDHLEPGAPADNTRDMMERGRHYLHDRKECRNGHDLTAPGALRIAKRYGRPYSMCVECNRIRQRKWQNKRKRSHSQH